MARRKAAAKQAILPDPLFENGTIAKFINIVMRCGKKSLAEKIIYGALDQLMTRYHSKTKAASKEAEVASGEGNKGKMSEGGKSKTDTHAKGKVSIKDSAGLRTQALELFSKILNEVKPAVEVKSRRVGGATYQVPTAVTEERGIALAMGWLVESAKKRGEKSMSLRLAAEFLDALEGKGGAIKKREDTHKMAKANQAFAHYRW